MCMAPNIGLMGRAMKNIKTGGIPPAGSLSGKFAPFFEGVNAASRENIAMRSELATLRAKAASQPQAAPGASAPSAPPVSNFGVSAPASDFGSLFAGPKNQSSAGKERVIRS